MPELKVCSVAEEDVYKDIARIPQAHRVDKKGNPIEESTVCWVDGTPSRSLVVLRGYKGAAGAAGAEIHMDERTRDRLGVKLGEVHNFRFRAAGHWGQFRWALTASETGYRVASRIAAVSLFVGFIGLIPVSIDWAKSFRPSSKVEPQANNGSRPEPQEIWDRMRQCSEETDRLAVRFGWSARDRQRLNHYNAELNRCFVVTESANFAPAVLELDDLYDASEGSAIAERSVTKTGAVCTARSKPWSERFQPVDCAKYDQIVQDRMEK
jgi:hypothetical protein